jgi:DMSO reductase anchor subunit
VLHLGRPLYAFRAILGLRSSWVSREIVAFGLFAPLASLYAVSFAPGVHFPDGVREALRASVAIVGAVGVLCSVLIYHATRRVWWRLASSGFKFVMTGIVLGLALAVFTLSVGATGPAWPYHAELSWLACRAAHLLVGAGVLKALGELSVLRHLRDRRYTDLRRTAVLLTADLWRYTLARYLLLAVGLGLSLTQRPGHTSAPLAAVALLLLAAGELLERTLFFAAATSRAMPGGLP